MSVREEERQKNNCPSRGLGLAAAAIGVGVGAALYYFFNKRPENPDTEGSTSSNWACEESQALTKSDLQHPITMSDESTTDVSIMDEDDYVTISEHSTTDTSIISSETSSESTASDDSGESVISNSIESFSNIDREDSDHEDSSSWPAQSSGFYAQTISSDSEMNDEWDVTSDSMDVPTDTMQRSPVHRLLNIVIDLLSPTSESMRSTFRQRSWSLEECSICCDVMLKDQQLEELPCAHSFHAACVRPWLHEHRTCPNCRKLA